MDERQRQLERRFKETGSVDDETAWLLERVRGAGVDLGKLQLAAYLGHPAARAVAREPEIEPLVAAYLSGNQLQAIRDAGQQAAIRMCLAVSDKALSTLDRPEPQAGRLLDSLAAWALSPGPARREAVCLCVRGTKGLWGNRGHSKQRGQRVLQLAYNACQLLEAHEPDGVSIVEVNDEVIRKDVHFFTARDAVDVLSLSRPILGEDLFDDALGAEVVPWLLGYDDPVRRRAGYAC